MWIVSLAAPSLGGERGRPRRPRAQEVEVTQVPLGRAVNVW